MQCSKCKSETNQKSGEKNGKRWSGSFCPNCKNVDWDNPTVQKPLPKTFVPDERDVAREMGLQHGNAKNCASVLLAAAIKSGEVTFEDALTRFHKVVERIEFIPEDNI